MSAGNQGQAQGTGADGGAASLAVRLAWVGANRIAGRWQGVSGVIGPPWRKRLLSRVLVWGALVLIWELAARSKGPLFLPTPLATAEGVVHLFTQGYANAIAGSLRHLFLGFGMAVAVGIPVGLLMGSVRVLDDFLSPYVNSLFIVSKEALLPFFIIMLGTQLRFRVVLVFVFAVFMIIMNTAAGVRSVDPKLIETARAFRLSRLRIFTRVVVPASLPYIIAGVRLGFGLAIKGMVIAEIWVTVGLGLLLQNFGQFFRLNLFYAVAIVLVALSVAANGLLGMLERRLRRWAEAGHVTSAESSYWLSNYGHNVIWLRWALRAAAIALVLVAWELVGRSNVFIAVTPATKVIPQMVHDILHGPLATAGLKTLRIAALGYLISAGVGIVVGSVVGLSRIARWTIEPILYAGNAAPMAMFIPVLGIYVGFEDKAKIFLVFIFCVFVIAFNAAAGTSQAPRALLETARSFGVRGWWLYAKVIFPNAFPAILVGLRIGVARAIQGAILGDLLLQSTALGRYLARAGAELDINRLLAGVLLAVILGTGLMALARRAEMRLLRGR